MPLAAASVSLSPSRFLSPSTASRRRFLRYLLYAPPRPPPPLRRCAPYHWMAENMRPSIDLFPPSLALGQSSSPARTQIAMEEEAARGARRETFNPDLIHAIFKLTWSRRTERGGGAGGGDDVVEVEPQPGPETSRRNRSTTANASALQVSCELLCMFVTEAVQRSAVIAEAEGTTTIEPTHLERVLPQLLLDF